MITILHGFLVGFILRFYAIPYLLKLYCLDVRPSRKRSIFFIILGCGLHISVVMHIDPTLRTTFLGFVWVGMMLSFIDIEHLILPNVLVATLGALGFVTNYVGRHATLSQLLFTGLFSYLSLCALSALYIRFRRQVGLGQGDVKLMSVLSVWFGYYKLCVIVWAASLAALVWISIGIFFRNKRYDIPVPFGPFLLGSSLLYLFKL